MATNIKNIYGIEMNDCKISGDIIVTDGTRPILSNSPKIGKKEEKLREAVHEHYQCNGKYPCSECAYCRFCEGENIAHDCDEDCCADEFSEGFLSGWDACMRNLAELPWDEAINEIVNNCKEKEY